MYWDKANAQQKLFDIRIDYFDFYYFTIQIGRAGCTCGALAKRNNTFLKIEGDGKEKKITP